MTREIHYRTAELRHSEGRTVYGCVAPYGQAVDITDAFGTYREQFAHGAFGRSISERGHKVRLLIGHDSRRLAIGKAVELREDSAGLFAAFEVANTTDGNDALELVRDGTVDSFSIGFVPIRDRKDGDVTVRVEAALREVSLVNWPAYSGALVAGVRSRGLIIPTDVAAARLRLLDL